ncbi:MAG: DTW domain-containing protein [Oligoflexia bacterium]|nr:DTW domain-containing protein [Oligoflexia bacterium]
MAEPSIVVVENCPHCQKAPALCVCESIQQLAARHHVLILQHPQEPDHDLGSARIAHLSLPNSTLKVGLSWPNLKTALGKEAVNSRWAVLYLGSGIKAPTAGKKTGLIFVDKKGIPLEAAPTPKDLDGIVVIDGTWSQAKALWWRNAWLLKLKRAILIPSQPSLYKELRREPRKECLSTIETVADALEILGAPPATANGLRGTFKVLLDKRRAQLKEARAARKS